MSLAAKHASSFKRTSRKLDIETLARLKEQLRRNAVPQLDMASVRALRRALRDGERAQARLERIQAALEYLAQGCAYPRAIRLRLKEISEDHWNAPGAAKDSTETAGINALWGL